MKSNSSLQDEIIKKDKTIAALSKYVERLTENHSGVITEIQIALQLETKLKHQRFKLINAEKNAANSQFILNTERDFMRATMNSLNEAVIVTDLNGTISYTNPAVQQLINVEDWSSVKKSINNALILKDSESNSIDLLASNKQNCHNTLNIAFFKHANGNQLAVEWSSAFITNKQFDALGIVFTINDVTDAHNLKTKLKHQASHDTLTGLLNRNEFDNRLTNCLSSRHDPNVKHSLIYIDLDQFKVVNDTCGHQAGDQLLKQLSTILAPRIRGRDTLSRIGGDEFAVLLENCPQHAARKIADELLRDIQDFRFSWNEKSFTLGASIGIAHFSSDTTNEKNPLSIADATCYKAKDDGRNRIHEVDITSDKHQLDSTHEQMHWVSRINNALDNNQFVLFQQKIAPTNPGANDLLHYEILLRLRDDDGSIINPGAFLPPAERYGLIHRVDQWVIKNTFAWLAKHPTVLANTKSCSINLSGLSLSDKNLSNYVTDCLHKYGIQSHKICFEITETAAIQNLGLAMSFMTNMHKLGCSFSLDDFGTGMSSFSYLKTLPVNNLKIDGSFVRDIHTDPIDLAMTRSINEIGHVMGMSTIAEFVENEEILQRLKQLGVDYVQGYHIAKPAPLDKLLKQTD